MFNKRSLLKFSIKKIIVFSLIIATLVVVSILFSTSLFAATTVTSNQTGTHDGYYYSFWNQGGGGSVTMTLGNGGNYSVNWSNCTNFTCGKGWSTGSANKNVSFSGSFNGGNNGYLALYGWTKNALIEYYVIENYGSWTPPGGNSIGTMNSDGGTYNIVKMQRVNQPSIVGTATFDQFFSVRTSKRSSGTITFSNHVNAWRNKGMNLGSTWDYMIMETEGYQSSGSANITVGDAGSSNSNTTNQTNTTTSAPAQSGTVQAESMTKSGQYTSNISSPFSGVALYANNDSITTSGNFSGSSSITCRGASNNSSTAQVALYIGSSKVGTFSFSGTSAANQTINFNANGTQTVKLVVENDTGSWDAYIDYITIGGGTTTTNNQSTTSSSTTSSTQSGTVQAESMTKSGQYTSNISSPFSGVALYANNDSITTSGNFSGSSSITCRGASNNSSTAQVALYIGSSKVGTFSFSGTSAANQTINFNANGTQTIKLVVENDTGSWDAYIDYITIGGGSVANNTNNSTTTTTPQNGTNGNVYLCFDDGPNNGNSQTLINALKSAGCNQATLFVWGNRISSNSSGWSAYTNSGFSLQNHSWTHSHMTSWSYQQVYNDLQQCSQAIQNAGKPKPTKIRLPYLESNSTIQQACSALGLSIVNPSVDTKDWNGANTQSIVSACNSLQAGGNPLMHDGYSSTNGAIPTIVQNLKNRGLGFAQY